MPLSFDELREKRKPRQKQVLVPLDEDLLRQIDELEKVLPFEEHLDQTENRPPKAARLRQRLDDLRAEAQQAAEEFTFRELPRPDYRALIAAHKDPKGRLRWNEDTFAPALIAACCVSHDYTLEQWRTLWNEWAAWVTAPLFATAYEVNEGDSQVPFGRSRSDGTTG